MKDNRGVKNLGSNLVKSFFVTIIAGLINVAYPLLIGLIYGPKTMGQFSILFYWINFLSIPIINGIAPATNRFIAAARVEDIHTLEGIGSKVTIFYILFISIIYPILSFTVFQLTVIEFFIVMSTLVLFIYHYLIRNILQGQEEFSKLLKLEIISFTIFVPFMIIFGILPEVLNWATLSEFSFLFLPIIVFHLAFDLIFLVMSFRKLSLKGFYRFPEITKKILLYALLVGSGSLFGLGTTQIQIIISEKFLSEFELGVLSFWNSAVSPVTLIAVTIGATLIPRITILSKTDDQTALELVNLVNWGLTFTVVPIIGLVFVFSKTNTNILDIVSLNKYQMDVYWPIFVLLCSHVINVLLARPSLSYISSSEKYVRINPVISFVFSLSAIISWFIFVPLYGIFGFAIGIAIGGVVYNILVQTFVLIISKGKIGNQLFVYLFFHVLNALMVFLLIDIWSSLGVILIWSSLGLPLLVFGIYQLIKVIKIGDFSKKMSVEVD